jgi:Cys-rich repeat protein
MRSFRRLALVLSALAGLSQLACSVPEGRFACTTNSDCPSGFVCRANGRCHSTPDDPTTDAAILLDAGAVDAWRDDAPGLDAFEGPLDAGRDDAFEIDDASEDAPAVDAFSPDDAPPRCQSDRRTHARCRTGSSLRRGDRDMRGYGRSGRIQYVCDPCRRRPLLGPRRERRPRQLDGNRGMSG